MRKQWTPGPFLSPREKGLGTRLDETLGFSPYVKIVHASALAIIILS